MWPAKLLAEADISSVYESLQGMCKSAVGDKFNLTMPTAETIGASMNASVSTSKGKNASATTTATSAAPASDSKKGNKDGAAVVSPPLAHIVSATVVMSVLLGGAALVL